MIIYSPFIAYCMGTVSSRVDYNGRNLNQTAECRVRYLDIMAGDVYTIHKHTLCIRSAYVVYTLWSVAVLYCHL